MLDSFTERDRSLSIHLGLVIIHSLGFSLSTSRSSFATLVDVFVISSQTCLLLPPSPWGQIVRNLYEAWPSLLTPIPRPTPREPAPALQNWTKKEKSNFSLLTRVCVCVCECLSLSIEVNKMKSIIKNAGEWRHIAIRWCLMWSCKRDIKWEDVVALFGRLSWGRRHGHRHWRFVSASRATHEKTFRRFAFFYS